MTGTGICRSRVLLADDHAATLQSWRALLEPDFDVVGCVGDGRTLVTEYERLRPDVIVTDVSMPQLNGIAAVEQIVRRHAGAQIVIVTVYADRALLRRGLAAGALGYVLKVRTGEDLVPAVRAALRGDVFISPLPPLDDTRGSG